MCVLNVALYIDMLFTLITMLYALSLLCVKLIGFLKNLQMLEILHINRKCRTNSASRAATEGKEAAKDLRQVPYTELERGVKKTCFICSVSDYTELLL